MHTRLTLLLGLLFAYAYSARAEGTKQLCPEDTDFVGLIINVNQYGDFAGYGSRGTSRMIVTLGNDIANERVYLGFGHALDDRGSSLSDPNAREDTWVRMLDPSGNVVFGPVAITAASANMTTHAEAVAGPQLPGVTGGYDPAGFTYTPAPNAVPGDYVIEFTNSADGTAAPADNDEFVYPLFDITVATRDADVVRPGRLWSRNWALTTPPAGLAQNTSYGPFIRQFRGKFHVYSPRGFVSEVDFLEAEFRPYTFNISFNEDGTNSGSNIRENIKSVNNRLATNPVHKVFLSDPDISLYPNGTYGTILENSEYPKLVGCTASGEYALRVAVTKPGVVEVLFDEDPTGGAGKYTTGTADRLLMYAVEPYAGEQAPYVRDIPWDGLDGQGNDISGDPALAVKTVYNQVAYHLPIFDAEYMEKGYEVELTRPVAPDGYQVEMLYDDSGIPDNYEEGVVTPAADKVNLDGTAPPTHTWSFDEFGNDNTINTFWYARRQPITQQMSIEAPQGGCAPVNGLEIAGRVYDDADGSFTQDNTESGQANVTALLYLDRDNDNTITPNDGAPVATTQTDANGNYLFSVSPGSTSERIVATGADGLDLNSTFRANFSGFGDFDDGNNLVPLQSGIHFSNVPYPNNQDFSDARIELFYGGRFNGATEADLPATIYAVNEDDADQFVTGGSIPSTASLTTSSVEWIIPSNLTLGDRLVTPDLSTLVKEVTSRTGFAPGNSIAFVIKGEGNNVRFFDFNDDPNRAPQLTLATAGPASYPATYLVSLDNTTLAPGLRLASDNVEVAQFAGNDARSSFGEFRVAGDRDNDGVVDANDLDNDNDGVPDANEDGGTGFSPTGDKDGDGTPNYLDGNDSALVGIAGVDRNGDGINDAYDADGDGVPDFYDLDSDNDGITDLVEAGGTDADGDGKADSPAGNPGARAVDEDGDGLADAYDNNPTDGPIGSGLDNTTPSTSNLYDTDADGVTDAGDSDNDGIANSVDVDSDNDGLTDLYEAKGTDADGDGRVDDTADADGDGIADAIDPKHDGPDATAANQPATAGTPVVRTGPDSGDGSPTVACLTCDPDGDGYASMYDLDADGDGITDAAEAGSTDADGDGRIDATADADGDGLADVHDLAHDGNDATPANEPTPGTAVADADTDGDGIADRLDRDSDADGIADVVEAGGIDADGDGEHDTATDANSDGLADDVEGGNALVVTGGGRDRDNDGLLDQLDRDADGDGIADYTEAGGSDADGDGRVDDDADADQDGLTDRFDTYDDDARATRAGVQPLAATDATGAIVDAYPGQGADQDADGAAAWLDRDSDNDGLFDLHEAGSAALDANNDGRVDAAPTTPLVTALADASGDGLADEGYNEAVLDADGDGVVNYRDLDSDDDGIADVTEQNAGATVNDAVSGDLDGRMPADPGADWTVNRTATALDSDGDGVPDYLDVDADNDGIRDRFEAVCSECPTTLAGTDMADANGNGVRDGYEGLTADNQPGGNNVGTSPVNVEGTGAVDYLDTDADDDGAYDYAEGFDDDGDGIAVDDYVARADALTTPGVYATGDDADADGIPDFLDNAPGATSYDEASRPPFLVPGSAYWVDANGNGLADLLDADAGNGATGSTRPNRDAADERDWRDNATLAPLPVTLASLTAEASGCDLVVRWEAATEIDLDRYVVEVAGDDGAFRAAASVPAAGAERPYGITVAGARDARVSYVRLRSVDLDGTRDLSDVLAVTTGCTAGPRALTYPNPATRGATLTVDVPRDGVLLVRDATGRAVSSLTVTAGSVAVPTEQLTPGVYTLVSPGGSAERIVIR